MGIFDFLKGKKKTAEPFDPNRATAEYLAKVQAEKRDTLSPEQEKELRKLYLTVAEEEGQEGALRAASALMMEKKYQDAEFAYRLIMDRFPDIKGLCLSQVGVCHSERGNSSQALETYLEARNAGAKASMIDDLIWYLCEEQFEAEGSSQWLQTYLTHSPEGRYRKEAEALLTA